MLRLTVSELSKLNSKRLLSLYKSERKKFLKLENRKVSFSDSDFEKLYNEYNFIKGSINTIKNELSTRGNID